MFCGNGAATAHITNSSITDNLGNAINSDTGPEGGGVSVANSTINGNSGAIYNSAVSSLGVSNSTISDNGSGIYNVGSRETDVLNSTMSDNGVEIRNIDGSLVTIGNTIFKVNPGGHSIVNDSGTSTSRGYNISNDDGGGYLNGPGDQINTDPLLGPLQDNGGPTFTHALLLGSPAINTGDPSLSAPVLRPARSGL